MSWFKASHKTLASSSQLSKATRDHSVARESDPRPHFQPAQIQKVLTVLLDFPGSPQVAVHTGCSTSTHRSFSTMLLRCFPLGPFWQLFDRWYKLPDTDFKVRYLRKQITADVFGVMLCDTDS